MKGRALVLLFGLGAAFLTLELGLRLLGVAYFVPIFATREASTPDIVAGPVTMREDAYRVLCLGNSHTQGFGDEIQGTYPGELQKLLSAKFPGKAFQVINAGRGNQNSSEVLEALPRLLESYRPHVVFAMVGEPNAWNYRYFYKFQGADSRLYDLLRGLKVVRLIDLLRRFDARNDAPLEQDPPLHSLSSPEFEYPVLASGWLAYLEAHPDLAKAPRGELEVARRAMGRWAAHPLAAGRRRLLSEMARIDFFFRRHVSGLDIAEKLVALPGGRFEFLLWKALEETAPRMSGHDLERAARLQRTLLARLPSPEALRQLSEFFRQESPQSTDPELIALAAASAPGESRACIPFVAQLMKRGTLAALRDAHADCGRENPYGEFARGPGADLSAFSKDDRFQVSLAMAVPSTAAEPFGGVFAENARKANPAYLSPAELGAETERLHRWVAEDLRKTVELVRDHGASIVLQTYPRYRQSRRERWVDFLVREAAKEHKAPLSDTSSAFGGIFAKEASEQYYFKENRSVQDDHLNIKGNRLVAELMLEALEKNRLLPR